jgi:hypothetical protein
VGKRLQEIPVAQNPDRVLLSLQPPHRAVYYELAAE